MRSAKSLNLFEMKKGPYNLLDNHFFADLFVGNIIMKNKCF